MNTRELAENIGIEEDEFLEMIELLIETCAVDFSKLQSAIDEGNEKEATEAAHSIKGASINFGLTEIYETAREI